MAARVIHFARSETEVANASTVTWADCVTLDFTAEANTDYYIMVNWQYNLSSTSSAALFRLTVDNSLVGEQYQRDGEATDEEITDFILHRHQQGGSSGTVSLALECLSESGSTVTFRAGSIVCIKKQGNDAYGEDLTDNTYTSTTWSSVASAAEAFGEDNDFLVVAQMNHGNNSLTGANQIRIRRDIGGGTAYYGMTAGIDMTATSNRLTHGLFLVTQGVSGGTTYRIQAAEGSTTTMTSYGARILLLDASGVTGAAGIGVHTNDADTDSSSWNDTTGTSYVSLAARTSQTFSASYTYLFLGHGNWLQSSSLSDGRNRFRIDGTVRPDTSNSHTAKVDVNASNDQVNNTFMDYEVGDGGTTHSYDLYYASGSADDIEQYDYSLIALAINPSVSVTVNPTGVSATGQVGNESVSIGVTSSVTGVSATGQVGIESVSTGVTSSVTGVSSTGQVGSVTIPNIWVFPSGVSATGAVGNESVSTGVTSSVTGVSGTGTLGDEGYAGPTAHHRPSGDVTDGNWLNELGSNVNLYASIDEAVASDSDYAISEYNASSNYFEVSLPSITDPSNDYAHTINYRIGSEFNQTPAPSMQVQVYLYQGAGQIAQMGNHAVTSSTPTNYSYTLTTAEAASITNYADLRLRFYATQN